MLARGSDLSTMNRDRRVKKMMLRLSIDKDVTTDVKGVGCEEQCAELSARGCSSWQLIHSRATERARYPGSMNLVDES